MWRPQFPAPLGVNLALHVLVHPTEAEAEHKIQVIVQTSDGMRIAEVGVAFRVGGTDLAPGEEYAAPIVVPLSAAVVPAPDGYSIEILIDGEHRQSVPFQARLAPNVLPPFTPPMPPATPLA